MTKTNAARILDRLRITYEILEYTIESEELGANHVARELGIPLEQVFKTLVVKGERTGLIVCCIPGHKELNLKKVATITNNKKVELVPSQEVLKLTGYLRGGCSPLGMKKHYPTFLDQSAFEHGWIVISGGLRGVQLRLGPDDLLKASLGQKEDLT